MEKHTLKVYHSGMQNIKSFAIKMYVDAANLASVDELKSEALVSGFTTNPTLMRQAGVENYLNFAREIVRLAHPLPVSLEVISDDFTEMESQAVLLNQLGKNVIVKIPITNTKGESSLPLVVTLTKKGIPVNVTAIMTKHQIESSIEALEGTPFGIISIFAGRIADSGQDPCEYIEHAIKRTTSNNIQVLWASPREIFNLIQAENLGCHIITMTPDLWKKLSIIGTDLDEYSRATVQMFYNDAQKAGYQLSLES